MIRVTPLILAALLLAAEYASPLPDKPSGPGKPAATKPRRDPKCHFLWREAGRVRDEAREYTSESTEETAPSVREAGSIAEWFAQTEILSARVTLLRNKAADCERGEALSSLTRIERVEMLRQKHLASARRRWSESSNNPEGDELTAVLGRINELYDQEAQSFYFPAKHPELDAEVAKDYPDLLQTIAGSPLPEEHKEFFRKYSKLIRYEEAGRLSNVLRGYIPDSGTGYAYVLRKRVAQRAETADTEARARAAAVERAQKEAAMETRTEWLIVGIIVLPIILILAAYASYSHAKYRAFRGKLTNVRFWLGLAELVLWNPGETVVVLDNKKLVQITQGKKRTGLVRRLLGQRFEEGEVPQGGYVVISPLLGQEFIQRISSKTKLLLWSSEGLHTSSGLPVMLTLGILWRINDRNRYFSRMAQDFHAGTAIDGHEVPPQGEAAELWIRTLADGTLREQVGRLPAERIISSHVQDFVFRPALAGGSTLQLPGAVDTTVPSVASGPTEANRPEFSMFIAEARQNLDGKLRPYGIEIEHVEVKQVELPPEFQRELEQLRTAFVRALRAVTETGAQAFNLQEIERIKARVLEERAKVLGPSMAGLIELYRNMSVTSVVPLAGVVPGVPIPPAFANAVNTQAAAATGTEGAKEDAARKA